MDLGGEPDTQMPYLQRRDMSVISNERIALERNGIEDTLSLEFHMTNDIEHTGMEQIASRFNRNETYD